MGDKVVFTDIDGTLIKGFITLDFANYLFREGLFDPVLYAAQINLTSLFKQKKINYVMWLSKWAEIWGKALEGKRQEEIISAAKDFFPEFICNIYDSSKDLISFFHDKGYFVVGISGGVSETANLIKKYLSIDKMFASELGVKNGIYTKKLVTKLHTNKGKEKVIIDFCKQQALDLSTSIGIGDTIHDLQVFNLTKTKIALNPKEDLYEYASSNNFLLATSANILEKVKKVV